MDSQENEKVMKENLERIQFWIGNVDAKISFLLALSGAILGFLLASESIDNIIKSYFDLSEKGWKLWIAILNGIIFVLAIYYIGKAVINFLQALRGRIDPKEYRQMGLDTRSLIFWGTIADRKRYQDFKDDLEKATNGEMLNDVQSQVYINSKITKTKFEIYNKGVKALSIGIILLIIFKILGFIPLK
jgi:hypothetical protein